MKTKKIYTSIIKLTIVCVLFFFIFKDFAFDKMMDIVSNLDFIYLLLTFCFFLLSLYFSALRLKKVTQIRKMNFFSLILKVSFFNNFLPAQIGGDIYKVTEINRFYKDKRKSIVSVFVDRLIGTIALVVFAFFNVAFGRSYFTDDRIFFSIIIFTLTLFVPHN
jgi:uncharacterized protein (TIRG00374 family)